MKFQILSIFKNSGVRINITDPINNTSYTVPRINLDSALSCLQQNISSSNWAGEYFDNNNLENGDANAKPVMIRDDGGGFLAKDFGTGAPESVCTPFLDSFLVRWTRTLYFPAAKYRFYVNADDGVRLEVDGIKRMDYWDQTAGEKYVDVPLDANNHVIKLEFCEWGGHAKAYLSWQPFPASPSSLNTLALSPNEIRLNWSDNSSDESGFKIE